MVFIVGLDMVVLHLGNLAGGLKDLNHMRATIGTRVGYAGVVSGGARAHDIVPRNAHALSWPGGGGGHPVARVHHPGTKPNPWLNEAFEARRGAIIGGIVSGLEDAVRNGDLHAAAGLAAAMDKTLELVQEEAPVRTGNLRRKLHTSYFSR